MEGKTLFPGNSTLPLTQTHTGIIPGTFCLNPPGCNTQKYLHLIKLVCREEHGLSVPCLQLYVSEERDFYRGSVALGWKEVHSTHRNSLISRLTDVFF